jgi:hypothetical protein|tara:strand:- start:2270 stop:2617 length:348 start_codon:yes stop_codon:yes gene_type:complete
MSTFEESIKNWVHYDNQIKQLQDKVKELRDKKSDEEFKIFNYAEENNLQKAVIEISDGKLKFSENKTTNPLSLKFVEKCLNEIIKNSDTVKQIMNYIKSNRESKTETNIKRLYNN